MSWPATGLERPRTASSLTCLSALPLARSRLAHPAGKLPTPLSILALRNMETILTLGASHMSGGTEDSFIADLSSGLVTGQIIEGCILLHFYCKDVDPSRYQAQG